MKKKLTTAGLAEQRGKFLIAKRPKGGDCCSKWEFPGGKVDPGETPEQALKREWREEFDLDIDVGPKICQGSFTHKADHFDLLAYRISIKKEPFELKEHTAVKWCTPEEILKLDLVESDKTIASWLVNKSKPI